jgi:hypothetical protein
MQVFKSCFLIELDSSVSYCYGQVLRYARIPKDPLRSLPSFLRTSAHKAKQQLLPYFSL